MLSNLQDVAIKEAIDGHNLVITGQAGTGKSYLLKVLLQRLKQAGHPVAIVATTGIAATQYTAHGGVTVHR